MRVVLAARAACGRRADLCILPNRRRADAFRTHTGTDRPVFCVWNCPSVEELTAQSASVQTDRVVLFFHGSIVPQRLPLTVLSAVAQCSRRVHFHFAGYETAGHLGYIEEIFARAATIGIADRIHYLGALPRDESLRCCGNADIGLALMPLHSNDPNMIDMVGASNKPFDYLSRGLPLLVSDLPEWNKAFVEPGLGRSCDPSEPNSIASALEWLTSHPSERLAMGEKGRLRIMKDWNYEAQFAPAKARILRESPITEAGE